MAPGFDRRHIAYELTDLQRERVIARSSPVLQRRRIIEILLPDRFLPCPDLLFPRPHSHFPPPRLAETLPPRKPIDVRRDLSLAKGQHGPTVGFSNPSAG